jgi:hypothetical protein
LACHGTPHPPFPPSTAMPKAAPSCKEETTPALAQVKKMRQIYYLWLEITIVRSRSPLYTGRSSESTGSSEHGFIVLKTALTMRRSFHLWLLKVLFPAFPTLSYSTTDPSLYFSQSGDCPMVLLILPVVMHNPWLWRGYVTSCHITECITFVIFDWDNAIPQPLHRFLSFLLCNKFYLVYVMY